jgi:cytidylate kinase
MPRPATITIDGPAGSGKSTTGERLAQQLNYLYFDTGVMYRAVTLVALRRGLECSDGEVMEHLAQQLRIDVQPPVQDDGRQYTVLVDGTDVTWELRSPDVDANVSVVSAHPGVRAELIRQQRQIGQRGQVVMVGRDIGTVVLPDAPLKIYLQTSLNERARRRMAEQQQKGHDVSLEHVRAALARRDELDAHVMHPASDALIVENDTLSPRETVEAIIALFE